MKYKLIKLLPFENSPRIGYTYSPNPLVEDKAHHWNGDWFNPKNYPEFWELVVEKAKQPLFTTEDGVDIFEGDKVYYIETNDTTENSFKVNEYTIQYSGRFLSDNTLHSFSTKEKAEEYILLNKPVLSLNDVMDCFDCSVLMTKNRLKIIVKSKIQQSV